MEVRSKRSVGVSADTMLGLLLVSPILITMAGLVFYPIGRTVWDSLHRVNPMQAATPFVGLDNYKGVLSDPQFRQSLLNNMKLLLAVPIMLGLGLAIALVLNDRIRGMRQYQAIVFLPYVLPATAIGIAFSFLLQENGVLNTALRHLHLGALAQDWLGNSHLAIVSVGGLVVWQQLGFGVVVFTAALLALPERYESVLRAKYLEQKSVAEVARAWNDSIKTIESLLISSTLIETALPPAIGEPEYLYKDTAAEPVPVENRLRLW